MYLRSGSGIFADVVSRGGIGVLWIGGGPRGVMVGDKTTEARGRGWPQGSEKV
jgi:hypothetical protein